MRGEELSPELLRLGYAQGWFPMTDDLGSVEWYRPYRRALLPIKVLGQNDSPREVRSAFRFGL